MNVYARFDEIPSMTQKTLRKQNVKDRCENSIPAHKQMAGGRTRMVHSVTRKDLTAS